MTETAPSSSMPGTPPAAPPVADEQVVRVPIPKNDMLVKAILGCIALVSSGALGLSNSRLDAIDKKLEGLTRLETRLDAIDKAAEKADVDGRLRVVESRLAALEARVK